MPTVRNRISGVIAEEPQHIIDHPVLGAHLELVDEDAKPIPAELVNVDKSEEIAANSRQKITDKDDK